MKCHFTFTFYFVVMEASTQATPRTWMKEQNSIKMAKAQNIQNHTNPKG